MEKKTTSRKKKTPETDPVEEIRSTQRVYTVKEEEVTHIVEDTEEEKVENVTQIEDEDTHQVESKIVKEEENTLTVENTDYRRGEDRSIEKP